MAPSKTSHFLQKHRGHFILLVLCMAIAGACTWTMWRHYTRHDPEGFIAAMENRLLDLRFRLRGEIKASGKIGEIGRAHV